MAREQAYLKEALEPAVAAGLCELVVEANASITSIIDTFQRARYQNRIAIFHYGGHADGYQLLLESLEGGNVIAHGAGLVSFFGKQPALRLIFLNGCSTQQQAEELVAAGIPAVIGTSQSISDDIATQLAARFYRSIGQGATLDRAWREAEDEVKMRSGGSTQRGILFRDNEKNSGGQFPWNIYYREGAEIVRDWNLPQAAGNPLFGIPEPPRDFDLPEMPYRFLRRFERRHAELFFGRGAYIRDVYQRLLDPHAAPVVLLYGQSGVGKSSLLEAGILPRLEQSSEPIYLRRDPEAGLTATLMVAFASTTQPNAATLKAAWLEREAKIGKPLLLILDQVEEVFTRARPDDPDELTSFLRLMQGVFDDPRQRPTGRLVLAYRKEFHPEIEEQCRQLEIPREKIFIQKLDRAAIIEVVNGLTSSERLRRRYGLEVEATLPEVIADDLLADPNSAIAPVLQILLTKMWELTAGEESPQFTVAHYHELRKAGILLDDFYAEQMAQLQAWNKEVTESGLALDLLHLHTTEMGTADSRDLEEIRRLYQHREALLDQLIARFKELYLLTGVSQEKTGLTHDAIVPIIQREIKDSDKPGQRAFRILTSKMPEYERSPETVYIDEEDLTLVERGAGGMRLWTLKEKELIEKSRARRAKLEAQRRRNRRLKMIAVLIIAGLAVIASLLAWQSNRKAQVSALINQALNQEKTDATKALALTFQALEIRPEDASALRARNTIYTDNEFYSRSMGHDTSVTKISISPNGQLVAAIAGSKVQLWKTEDEAATEPWKTIPHNSDLLSVSFSPDGQELITVDGSFAAYIWSVNDNSNVPLRTVTKKEDLIIHAVFSPDGQHLVTGGRDGAVRLWTVRGDSSRWYQLHQEYAPVTSLAFSPNGQMLLSGSIGDVEVHLWDLSGEKLRTFTHTAHVTSLAFSPDGQFLLTGCREDATAYYWSIDGGIPNPLRGHQQRINEVVFSRDGQQILTASMDKTIRAWTTGGKQLKTYRGHEGIVHALAGSPDGLHFASGGEQGQLRWWKFNSKVEQTFGPHAKGVLGVTLAPLGDGLLTTTGNGEHEAVLALNDPNIDEERIEQLFSPLPTYPAYYWNLQGEKIDSMTEHQEGINAVAIAPDNTLWLTGSDDDRAILWNRETRESVSLNGHRGDIWVVGFSPNGQTVATGGEDSTVILWNRQGDSLAVLPHSDVISALTFSPDGVQLLTGSGDGKIRCWDLEQQTTATFPKRTGMIRSLAFSPDGELIAAGESGGVQAVVSIWSASGELRDSLIINSQNRTGGRGINSLTFSPDGKYVLVGAEGGLAVLFDLAGRVVQTLNDFNDFGVNSASFSPDGQCIMTGSGDGWARLFKNLTYRNPWAYDPR